jgi:Cu(I)/Ag(I) efflux system membrane fusion protein
VLAGAAISGLLAVQSARHGWPFSAHHGYGEAPKRAAVGAAPKMGGEPSPQPRAPVELAEERAAQFGVTVEKVRREPAARNVRAVAVVVPDESRVSEVHTRVAGWIEQLYVNKTGQTVRAGQALAAIYSPDLLAAQNELFALKKAPAIGGTNPLLQGSRSRLGVLGMSARQIEAIEKRGSPLRLVSVSSPRKGVVIRRNIAVGTAVDPSTELMTIADLSKIWVLAEIPERDVPGVPVGTHGALEFPAAGADKLESQVAFVYPTLTQRTRTLRVRFELDNPKTVLKPGMYGTATFETAPREALTVARDAVVDTGLEQHVFVVEGPGRYVPRRVQTGVQLGDRIEILSGLEQNETVVASGVFVIDSESRLRASGGGGAHTHGAAPRDKGAPKPAGEHEGMPMPPPKPEVPADPHSGHGR